MRQAIARQKGWGMTEKDVVPKLCIKGFPSTRRVAIEFLKRENNGNDFGFIWQEEPDSKKNWAAIRKWKEWLIQTNRNQKEPR